MDFGSPMLYQYKEKKTAFSKGEGGRGMSFCGFPLVYSFIMNCLQRISCVHLRVFCALNDALFSYVLRFHTFAKTRKVMAIGPSSPV